MKTILNLDSISDGKLYTIGDRVNADTGGCLDCYSCCHDIGEMVVLNPFDVYTLKRHLNLSFDQLLKQHLQIQTYDHITLPFLKMVGDTNHCNFLNTENRCGIHLHRPDICRLFPLGRVYEGDDFKFFLQVNACVKPDLSEIAVEKWIGIEHYNENKAFILEWYRLIKALTFRMKFVRDETQQSSIQNELLDIFYHMTPNENEDFYAVFYSILPQAKSRLGIL